MRIFAACALAFSLSAQPPDYSAAGLVDAAANVPGRFSPNSRATLYGARLTHANPTGGRIAVYVGRREAEVTYVSASQINFIVPGDFPAGRRQTFSVSWNGVSGPEFTIDILPESPELFIWPSAYALAARTDGSLVVPGAPAAPNDIVVLYGNGLGPTLAGGSALRRPVATADPLRARLDVWLDGRLLPAENLLYAGLAPGYVALYQINLRLPADVGPNPIIRLGFGGEPSSHPDVRLAVGGSGNAATP